MRTSIRALVFSLLLSAAAAFAADQPVTEDMLQPLTTGYMRVVKPGDAAEMHRELLGAIVRRVQRSYAQDVDVRAFIAAAVKTFEPLQPQSGDAAVVFRKAVNTALATLDPHSRYLDARAESNESSAIMGAFGGLGMEVEMVDGLLRIVAPMPGTPAARAGLQRGDFIVRFDDHSAQGLTLADAINRMRGQPGTPISLTIRRTGLSDDFTLPLVREIIKTQSLRWTMEGDVLVLRLTSFTSSVATALEQAIAEATAKARPRAVVLDMRGNGGGLLRPAIRVADTFLRSGEIVSLRGRTPGNQRTWHADSEERLAGLPMVVLLDERSASATELVAAALQENGRAVVMGRRSFGKGSVQSTVSLGSEKGALKLTTALYHGPSGRTVQRTGVGPDIELLGMGDTAPRTVRREADRGNALPGADEPAPPQASVEAGRCAKPRANIDPALACAIAFVHAGAIDSFVAALDPTESAATR